MKLNQLKIFYTAAKRGNLSNAAEDLFITQPAVTKGIQRMQERYDIRLMDRFGKKLILTNTGEVLFYNCRKDIRAGKTCRRKYSRIQAA